MNLTTSFKSLQIIFMALITGVVLFGIIMSLVIVTDGNLDFSLDVFPLVGITFSIICTFMSGFVFQVLVRRISREDLPEQKFQQYQAAKIVSWALLEGAILFNIVLVMLESNYLFLLFAIILLLVFITKVPSKSKLLTEAKFTEEEIRLLG